MAATNKAREADLCTKEICRFCLTQQSKLGSIYIENARVKSTATLPLQIMAITSIEVNSEDGMPGFICLDCRLLFEHSYRFKQMCKRADTLLRQYPLTGQWPEPLEKPRAPLIASQVSKKDVAEAQPIKLLNSMAKANIELDNVHVMETSTPPPKKLLNSGAAATAEPALFKRSPGLKRTNPNSQAYQHKVENNQELSMDDVHHLIADIADELDSYSAQTYTMKSPVKPKLLNKSSMRILNKGATESPEPRLAAPQIKRDEAGNVAIVTEILDPRVPDKTDDVVRNAAPVATNVFPCPHCERSFPLLQLLEIHVVNHTRTRSFQCTECDKSFFSKYDLQKHNFVHTGERPYKCSICDKAFTRGALLHRHERTHTDVPKFICVYCEKPFISREEMEKHAERHTKKRPFQCSICSKSFAFKQGLERHEVMHCTDLPFQCQYCKQSFVTAGKLSRHLVAHAGKRAYPCKYCPKSYLLSHHLSRHLRSHNQGAATFMCSVCKDIHQTYDSLVDHLAIHATSTLICPLCKENINDQDNVERHIQAHKKSETFACEFCDLIFLHSSELQVHIEDDHVVDMVPYQKTGQENLPDIAVGIKEESDILQQLLGDDGEQLNIEQSENDSPLRRRSKIRKLNNIKNEGTESTAEVSEGRRKKIKTESSSPDKEIQTRTAKQQTVSSKLATSPERKRQSRRNVLIANDDEKTTEQSDSEKSEQKSAKKETEITAKQGRSVSKNGKVSSSGKSTK